MGGAYAFVLWAWLDTSPPPPRPAQNVTLSATGQVNPEITWKPRSIYELLALDSPLTNADIQALFPSPPRSPVRGKPPYRATPLFPMPSDMVPGEQVAADLALALFSMDGESSNDTEEQTLSRILTLL